MEVSSKRVVGLALLGLVISSSSLAQSGSDIFVFIRARAAFRN